MASTFQVNINITAGVQFTQEYTITNADRTPTDLTGFTFYANLAKHEEALNAVTSTSDSPVWKYCALTTNIVNATGGKYTIALTPTESSKLDEGKYVYSVVMLDSRGVYTEVVRGLAFVNKAFGFISTGTVDLEY